MTIILLVMMGKIRKSALLGKYGKSIARSSTPTPMVVAILEILIAGPVTMPVDVIPVVVIPAVIPVGIPDLRTVSMYVNSGCCLNGHHPR